MTSNSADNRYARQQQYAPIGREGQARIAAADVAVLGCGALGTVAAEILARAGVGRLRLIDRDIVEWTNLQRQSLYLENDAQEGKAKAAAAAEHLARINSAITIVPEVVDVTSENIRRLLNECDLVIDAADNFPLRFLLNDWSLLTRTPWVHGGCVGASGQVRLFVGTGPCFRCLVPQPPPAASVQTCDTAGVVGSATHLIASLQATEAIKWLCGARESIREPVLSIDLWNNRIREIEISTELSAECLACRGQLDFLDGDRRIGSEGDAKLCGRDAVQIRTAPGQAINFDQVAGRWEGVGVIQQTRFFIRLTPDQTHTLTLFRDGRAVITGTEEISKAKSLYAQYVGS